MLRKLKLFFFGRSVEEKIKRIKELEKIKRKHLISIIYSANIRIKNTRRCNSEELIKIIIKYNK